MKKLTVVAALSAFLFSSASLAETLDNDDVLSLLQAGLGEEAVIAKIETESGEYETDIETLLALRDKGVSSAVIAAMVKKSSEIPELSNNSPDPTVPHFAGIYLMDNWSEEAQMLKIDPIASTQTKTGGFLGYALTGGLASASVKAVLPGESAKNLSQDSTPTFYLYLDNSAGNSSGTFTSGFGPSLQSPNELSLVKLKKKKGRREARVGSLNIAGAKTGVMDKDRIPFEYEQIAPGVFSIQVTEPLKKGQYGFIFAVTGGAGPGVGGAAGGARVFGFGIE